MPPDAASSDAARCLQMMPGAPRCCQMIPDDTDDPRCCQMLPAQMPPDARCWLMLPIPTPMPIPTPTQMPIQMPTPTTIPTPIPIQISTYNQKQYPYRFRVLPKGNFLVFIVVGYAQTAAVGSVLLIGSTVYTKLSGRSGRLSFDR